MSRLAQLLMPLSAGAHRHPLLLFTDAAGELTDVHCAWVGGQLADLFVLCASAARNAALMGAGITLMPHTALQEEACDGGGEAGRVSQTLGKGRWQPGSHQRTRQRPAC